jgi:sortase A
LLVIRIALNRRRLKRAVALVLIAAGVVIMGYLTWQFFGSNLVAHHRQRELVEQLDRSWAAGAGPDAESGHVGLGRADALMRVPRFGHSYVMPVLEGTSDDVLSRGIGHFEGSAQAGQEGNYALAAHRITHGEPFADLPDLRPGDDVLVETRTAVYTYVIDTDPNRLIVARTEEWVLEPQPRNPDAAGVQPDLSEGNRLITLTTCSELFHTDDRMVTFGHLVGVSPKEVPLSTPKA